MAYFAALLARMGEGWVATEPDLDGVADLAELTAVVRAAGDDDRPVLLLLEQEDAWFGVVRVDGEDDPRVFVSDLAATGGSGLARILVPDADDGIDLGALVDAGSGVAVPGPAGDAELLEDLGTDATELIELCGAEGLPPSEAINVIAERTGAGDIYEAMR